MKVVIEDLKNVLQPELSKRLKVLNTNTTYSVVFNLINGEYQLCNDGRCKDSQLLILKLKIVDCKADAAKIRTAIAKDGKSSLICHTNFIKSYKSLIGKVEPLTEIKNPYYSNAARMKLYDTRMLNYRLR